MYQTLHEKGNFMEFLLVSVVKTMEKYHMLKIQVFIFTDIPVYNMIAFFSILSLNMDLF